MKILLIDDDKDLCQLTKIALLKNGYEVAAFHGAEEGINDARKSKPNLILMDVMLPGLSGAEAVRILQSDSSLRNVPVIFLTALVTGEETKFMNVGLNISGLNYRTLGKPYNIDKLLEVVKNNAK